PGPDGEPCDLNSGHAGRHEANAKRCPRWARVAWDYVNPADYRLDAEIAAGVNALGGHLLAIGQAGAGAWGVAWPAHRPSPTSPARARPSSGTKAPAPSRTSTSARPRAASGTARSNSARCPAV